MRCVTVSQSELAALGAQCRERFFTVNGDLDAVITDDPIHIGYLSGYRSILQDMPPYTQALVATRDSIALITGASDGAAALEVLGDPEIIWRYGTFYVSSSGDLPSYQDMPSSSESAAEALAASLKALPRGLEKIGCDLHQPELRSVAEAALRRAKLISVVDGFRRSRAIKLPGELDFLRHSSRITDKAIEDVTGMMRPGITELEIAAEITRAIAVGGGIARFVVVTSGERSSRVDAYARNRALQEGELVRMDVGATVNGYYSDMARTYSVGEPSPYVSDRYSALLKGELVELGLIRPGITAREIFDAAIREVRAGALPEYQRNHCGHGIGLRAHEFPLIGPASETELEPGMVLCVETPYYEVGWGGMMVEDTVIVTDGGHELLTKSPRDLCQSI